MFKVILKGKFKERRIDLSIVSRVMYHQPLQDLFRKNILPGGRDIGLNQ